MNQDLMPIALEQVKKAAAQHQCQFPESLYKHIAFRMMKENHLEDEQWLAQELTQTQQYVEHKRDLATRGGYAPFTFMGKSAYLWIQKNCAQWVLPAMEKSFRDPEDIHPDWAVQCAKTLSVIGKEEAEEQDNLYTFVTGHPEWRVQEEARDSYRRDQSRFRRHQPPMGQNRGPRREPQNHTRVDRMPSQALLVPCELEVILRFDQLPKSQRASDRDFTLVELGASQGRVVAVELRRTFYDKLLTMEESKTPWLAVVSGSLGEDATGSLMVSNPFCRVYPKASAPQE